MVVRAPNLLPTGLYLNTINSLHEQHNARERVVAAFNQTQKSSVKKVRPGKQVLPHLSKKKKKKRSASSSFLWGAGSFLRR